MWTGFTKQINIGRVGVTLNVNWAEPVNATNPADLEAQENDLQFNLGWYAKPILVDGAYPDVMREKVLINGGNQ